MLTGPRFGPAAGRPRQLIVLVHGIGADGNDLIGLAPVWSAAAPGAVFVAPHAPFAYDQAPMGRQWFSVADRTPALIEAGVRAARDALDPFLDAELARYGLPGSELILMGFSQGAMTVLFTGLRRPVAPRGILAFSGALLAPGLLIGQMRNHVPVLIVHGEEDMQVPVARSREAERSLIAASVPVEAHYIPHLGHSIDEVGLAAGAAFLQRILGSA